MNIYVGNLSREVTERDLRHAFEDFGQVTSVKVITDKVNGVSRGLGFVEMPNNAEANAAISSLNARPLRGQRIIVK